ncbi:MAG: hypothetical protein JNK72_07475 [Myxococcales bacterium]|nr:hypothetical protein [Myxococcales bacterium]
MTSARLVFVLCLVTACGGQRISPAASPDAAAPDVSAPGCQTAADCDDGLSCTADRCEAGQCRALAIDTRCAEGLRCDPAAGCVDPRCGLGRRLCAQAEGPRACFDVLFDEAHCGDCDRRCNPGERCVQGRCERRVGAIGDRCREDSFCVDGLVCDAALGGVCSRSCQGDHQTPAVEAAACEDPQATCLDTDGVTGSGACLRRCDPRASVEADGACRAGFVCTGLWLRQRSAWPDTAACARFCSDSSDCAGDPEGALCNPRTGRCGLSLAPDTALEDGTACDPSALDDVCRGQCFRVNGGGLCGSLIDRRLRRACPDAPAQITAAGPVGADNLGLCMYRSCVDNCECPRGLVCIYLKDPSGAPTPAPTGLCAYPSRNQPAGVARDGGCGP